MTISSSQLAQRRRTRTRAKLRKVSKQRPRLSVFRSDRHIYVQVIDDVAGRSRPMDPAEPIRVTLRAGEKERELRRVHGPRGGPSRAG